MYQHIYVTVLSVWPFVLYSLIYIWILTLSKQMRKHLKRL